MTALPLTSFKLQFHDVRVRAVPARTEDDCVFAGPGVDLVRDEARAAFALCKPILDWFEAREPGARVRSLSCDLARGRILATIEATQGRPHVVRVDRPLSDEIVRAAAPLLDHLGIAVLDKIRQRAL